MAFVRLLLSCTDFDRAISDFSGSGSKLESLDSLAAEVLSSGVLGEDSLASDPVSSAPGSAGLVSGDGVVVNVLPREKGDTVDPMLPGESREPALHHAKACFQQGGIERR